MLLVVKANQLFSRLSAEQWEDEEEEKEGGEDKGEEEEGWRGRWDNVYSKIKPIR